MPCLENPTHTLHIIGMVGEYYARAVRQYSIFGRELHHTPFPRGGRSYGIEHGHEDIFSDLERSQPSPGQSFSNFCMLFRSGGRSTEVCTKASKRSRSFGEIRQCSSFTVLVFKFLKLKVEKNSVDKAKIEDRFVKLADAVEDKKIEAEQ